MNYRFSPSSLNLMKECPRCFWLQFNKNIRRPSGIFPSLPGGVDKILKNHFDNYRAKEQVPPELELANVKLFGDLDVLNRWRNNRRGIRFVDEDDNLILGAVDEVLVKNNKLIVLDYKTRGYPLKEDTHKFYQDQVDIYTWLLQKEGYDTENYAYLLFFHPDKVNKKAEIIFNLDLIKMSVNVKNAEAIIKKAKKVLKDKCPEPHDCQYCKWSSNVQEHQT